MAIKNGDTNNGSHYLHCIFNLTLFVKGFLVFFYDL